LLNSRYFQYLKIVFVLHYFQFSINSYNEDLKRKYFLSEIILFVNLKEFDISNKLPWFPFPRLFSEIGSLKKLEKLNLRGNWIEEIPPEIGNLENLIELNLSINKINIPKEICNLKKLNLLNFSSNYNIDIQTLKYIAELKTLNYLDFGFNHIGKLPLEFTQLKKLRKLSLKHNRFGNDLFDILAELTDIEYINLSRNRVKDNFSLEYILKLSRLGKLQVLKLKGNNLQKHRSSLLSVFGDTIQI